MKILLKPLEQQVIVIVGASSGIGLATARLAASRGARLVLVGRSARALRQLAHDICAASGEAIAVVADNTSQEDVRRVADEAVRAFGGFDTWVNNAAVSAYGSGDRHAVRGTRDELLPRSTDPQGARLLATIGRRRHPLRR
jgi:short-subunit dehydrogenase